jgi:hypothetical protein
MSIMLCNSLAVLVQYGMFDVFVKYPHEGSAGQVLAVV